MKITKIDAVPFKTTVPFKTMPPPHKSWQKHVLVIVDTDESISGVGETIPEPPAYARETQESVLHCIRNYIGPGILGKDPFDIEVWQEEIRRTIGDGSPFAVAAIDLALYDIMGKKTGLPVCKLLGGSYRQKIPLAWTIGRPLPTAEDSARMASDAAQAGFTTVKLKVGEDEVEDLDRLKSIRNAVGTEVEIRVDANQRWGTPERALRIIRKMEKYDLQLVEQPIAWWDTSGMSELARAIDTPIEADESAFSFHDVMRVIRMNAADIINVKVLKGGLFLSKKIAAIAEAANMPCLVGGFWETDIGAAAAAHFSAATRIVSYACEFGGPLTQERIVKEPLKIGNGCVEVPKRPGLGVELDAARLRELTRAQ